MTEERFARIEQVLAQRQLSMAVITDGTHKNHNIAAIARSCDAFGVHQLHLVGEQEIRYHRRISGGTLGWLDVHKHPNTESALQQARNKGHRLVAAHLSAEAIPYTQFDFCQPFSLIMGSELQGVSSYSQQQADAHLVIPMQGMVESLNVSVACALILAEAQRQRQSRDPLRYRNEIQGELKHYWLVRWLYPKIAHHCDQHQLPYPPLNEHGELHEPAKWYQQQRG